MRKKKAVCQMRSFDVTVYSNAIECVEVMELSRVDYAAEGTGCEPLRYRVSVSQKRGKVRRGRDRGANYVHYHAKNIQPAYKFKKPREVSS